MEKIMRLYIDDERHPRSEDFDIIIRSYDDFVNMFNEYCPQYVSFDHDLGIGKTGYDIAKYIVEMDLNMEGKYLPEDFDFNVHSANSVGRDNIIGYLKGYLKEKDLSK